MEANFLPGIWVPICLFFRRQYQRLVFNRLNHIHLSTVFRRQCQCCLVLGDLGGRLYVSCCERPPRAVSLPNASP